MLMSGELNVESLILSFQGGRGHWTVNKFDAQCVIKMFSLSLAPTLGTFIISLLFVSIQRAESNV